MKVVVSASGPDLDAQVDPRFGRCPYFVVIDSDTMKWEAFPNDSAGAMGGAGIQAAQNVANRGTDVVLTGNCGPNAFRTLEAGGVQVIVGVAGSVREAVQRFQKGELQVTAGANVQSHFGTGGSGGGMGQGMGRGMGQGMGQNMRQSQQAPAGDNDAAEVSQLQAQMEMLQQQLKQIQERIQELKGS